MNVRRASGINRAFMQARSLAAGPVIAASIAAGMPLGSIGSAQPAFGACAIALPASAPARIVAENSVCSIFSPSRIAGNAREALAGDLPEPARPGQSLPPVYTHGCAHDG